METVKIADYYGADDNVYDVSDNVYSEGIKNTIKKYNIKEFKNFRHRNAIEPTNGNTIVVNYKGEIKCCHYIEVEDDIFGDSLEYILRTPGFGGTAYDCGTYNIRDYYIKNRERYVKKNINYDADVTKDQITIFDMKGMI